MPLGLEGVRRFHIPSSDWTYYWRLPAKTPRRRAPMRTLIAAGFTALALASAPAIAQSDYPNRPVKLVIGFGAGGSTDIVGRIVAKHLTEKLGQAFVVENKAGAGGTIGADLVAKSPPDGYTLTLGTTSTHAIAAGAYSKLPYNPVTDFTHVSLVAITPY